MGFQYGKWLDVKRNIFVRNALVINALNVLAWI